MLLESTRGMRGSRNLSFTGGGTTNVAVTASGVEASAIFNATNAADTLVMLNADALLFTSFWGTNAAVHNDTVACWKDSKYTNDVVSTYTAGPALHTNQLNGHAALEFVDDQLFTKSNTVSWAQPQTVYWVGRNMTSRAAYSFFFDGVQDGNRQLAYLNSTTMPAGAITANAGGVGAAGTTPGTNWIAWAFVFNGASSAIWSNGFQIATGNVGTQTSIGDSLGIRFTQSNPLNPGAIAWFQRCANAGTDVTNMWNYASNRFALP